MSTPFFSIIIPVYNVEQYLEDCIRSIINQDYKNYEIICINDASTDNSLEVLQKLKEKYLFADICIVENDKNEGLSYTRNRGLELAKGEYVWFVDSDDMIAENSLSILYDTVSGEELDIVYFDMEVRDEAKWAKERKYNPQKYEYKNLYSGEELFVAFYRNGDFKVESCRQLYSREFLLKNELRFYEKIFHEDNLFFAISLLSAKKVKNLTRDLYIYRRRDGSIMSRLSLARVQSVFIVFSELMNFWNVHGFSEEVNKAFEAYIRGIYRTYKCLSMYFPKDMKLKYGNSANQFLYTLFEKEYEYEYVSFSREKIKYLVSAERILVYGAGMVAGETISFLKKIGMDIDAVIVSDKKLNPDKICDIRVCQVDEIENIREYTVVVGVSHKYLVEVVETLKEYGVSEILIPYEADGILSVL